MIDRQLESLAAELGAALAARGWLLATAESCTGGLVGAAVTAIAGSSAWFDRGFVTYSNHAKMDLLGVPANLLQTHGAVSEATALAMASGALTRSRAQIAVAITGIAGPGGGSADKPVGTVCFAWAIRDGASNARTAIFAGDRGAVRAQAACHALTGLIERVA